MSERPDTPLAAKIKALIRRSGPITLHAFMDACLQDPEHGYYRKQAVLGAGGDFITAPDISQVFGELIGLWSAACWQAQGAAGPLHLVELGPGRGTLMADALRACRIVPGFLDAVRVHLVETSEVLQRCQQASLAASAAPVSWHARLTSLVEAIPGPGMVVLIANEFLDTCPASQLIVTESGVHHRGVGLDETGALTYVTLPGSSHPAAPPAGAGIGDIFEVQDFGFMTEIARLASNRPFAGLFIDYGYPERSTGETLQAVRRHESEHPLATPGEADLTVHVDFAAFRAASETYGFQCDGPLIQAEFLGRLGLVERVSRLMARNPEKAGMIEAGAARLMAPGGMGSRFKVIGLRQGMTGPLPGF